jgi:hypothetical protein
MGGTAPAEGVNDKDRGMGNIVCFVVDVPHAPGKRGERSRPR